MIYTQGLDSGINHIMVYDGYTPIAIVHLSFYYSPQAEFSNGDYLTTEGWIEQVDKILEKYAQKFNLSYNILSAKPVNIINDWDLR